MASLEEAYSHEYGDIIDAEMAYDLYWSGVIFDQSAFECPSEYCHGKVSCANMYAEKQDMHQTPHFRSYHHDDGCDATRGRKPTSSAGESCEVDTKGPEKEPLIPDTFKLNRPDNQFAQQHKGKADNQKQRAIDTRQRTAMNGERSKSGSSYYTVRSLVTKFLCYKKNGSLREHAVDMAGDIVTYSELFKGVYHQSISALPQKRLIYWGVAYIDYLSEKQSYRVCYEQVLKHNDKEIRPSFFIPQGMIDDYPIKKLVIKRLATISESNSKRAFVFLFSEPYVQSEHYINFKLESLDHLEIRYLDLFDELRKSERTTDK